MHLVDKVNRTVGQASHCECLFTAQDYPLYLVIEVVFWYMKSRRALANPGFGSFILIKGLNFLTGLLATRTQNICSIQSQAPVPTSASSFAFASRDHRNEGVAASVEVSCEICSFPEAVLSSRMSLAFRTEQPL